MQGIGTKKMPPAECWDSFQFAGVYFTEVEVYPATREVRLPRADITGILYKRFNRRELDRIARACERSTIAKDSPVAFVEGIRRPFAEFLLEQVKLVLAGGTREC